jgi:hypothetical protein
VVDEFHGTDGCVDLANATLQKNETGFAQLSDHKVFVVMPLHTSVSEQRLELRELLVHRNDDSDCLQTCLLVSDTWQGCWQAAAHAKCFHGKVTKNRSILHF